MSLPSAGYNGITLLAVEGMSCLRKPAVKVGSQLGLFGGRIDEINISFVSFSHHKVKVCNPAEALCLPCSVESILFKLLQSYHTLTLIAEYNLSFKNHEDSVVVRQL